MNKCNSFSQQTLDFLLENRIADSKPWFLEHRDLYEAHVLAPFRALVEALAPAMLAIDPELICEPKVGRSISRIYRDTRFSKNKAIFREVMWCTFIRDKRIYHGLPAFFFELSPGGFRYGCGYYCAGTETMTAIRRLIVNNDKSWQAALQAFQAQKVFYLEVERYKRSRHPDQPEALRAWLDQKSICLLHDSDDFELLFSPALADRLAGDFTDIAPVYHFMMKAESQVDHRPARAR